MKPIKLFYVLAAFTAGWFIQAEAADPLRVFIRAGAKTHGPGAHDHPRFLAEWTTLLRDRGLEAAGGMTFPAADQLARTDVLVIYAADGMKITGAERARFEDFLRRGGGLVVIHDGVVSGDQHEWAKKVQGGAWRWDGERKTKWHEGEVGIYFVDQEHPISRGISNFDWNDEIYYDLDMAPDVQVLATSFHSVFVIAPQLWTYEKTWEGGTKPYRAVVSLPGHLHASFGMPHHRAILLRSIAWAGGRANADEFCSHEELGSLKYPQGGPTAPGKAPEKLNLHPEFDLDLIAAEPLIQNVISLDWDTEGRLWVAETPEYPNGRTIHRNDSPIYPYRSQDGERFSQRKEDRPAKDRISWLEDSDGDGVMDRKQVFYEGLELVTSLVFYKDGVLVAQAPDILWIRDTDQDGKGDQVVKLYSGFGTGDTHAVINNFRWGLDGWVYSAIGYSAGNPVSEDGTKAFGRVTAGVIRFKPDGSALEQYASGSCNTWGFDFGVDAEPFYTTATCGQHFLHIVMPEKVLARGSIAGVRASAVLPDHQKVFPAMHHTRPAYVQIDWVGMFTAASGSCVYNGGAWPAAFEGSHFLTEPTVNLVHHEYLTPKGATYLAQKDPAHEESEFIAGADLWFRPIHARVGPDGALYLVDFYNQAAIHNDTRGPAHGANNAATRPDRDHQMARLYRVQHKQAKTLPEWRFDRRDPAGLAGLVEHPNGWVRETAARLIRESGDGRAVDRLNAISTAGRSSAGRIAALWTIEMLGRLEDEVLAALIRDEDPAVRKTALRIVAERSEVPDRNVRESVIGQLDDSDPRAQLQALIAAGHFGTNQQTAAAVVKIWPQLQDPWLQSAAVGVAAQAPVRFLDAALEAPQPAALNGFVRELGRQVALRDDASTAGAFVIVASWADAQTDVLKQAALEAVAVSMRPNLQPEWTPELQQAFRRLLAAKAPEVPGAALALIGRWDREGTLKNECAPLIRRMERQMLDAALPDDLRAQSAVNLLGVRRLDPEIISEVTKLLGPASSIELQNRVVQALGNIEENEAGAALLTAFTRVPAELREAVFAQLIKRPEWSRLLIRALEDRALPLSTLGPGFVHRLRTHPDRGVAERAGEVITGLRGPEELEKEALIAQFRAVVEQRGEVENGRKLYTENCANCHVFRNEGRNLAPNLTGMGAHGPAELLAHIIDPNRLVEPNFLSWSIETKDGESFDGIIESENQRELLLRNASADYTIQQKDVATRRLTALSLMPEGFESLGAEGLRDLVAYLSSEGRKFRFIDLGKVTSANTTEGVFASKQSIRESIHFKQFGIVAANDIPFQVLHPSRTPTGNNVVILRGRNGLARQYPRHVEIDGLNLQATKLHILGGIGGWAWPFGGDEQKGLAVATITTTQADGTKTSWTLTNGVDVVDYIGSADVPGSKAAAGIVTSGQLRTLTYSLPSTAPLVKIELASPNSIVAPVFAAITAELHDALDHATGAKLEPAAPNAITSGVKPARVTILGGGSAHDYPRWWGQADVQTLNSTPGITARYTDEPDDLLELFSQTDVLYLAHNKPTPNVKVREGIFDFVKAGKGLLIVHAAGWYNWRDWPEFNRLLVTGGSRSHPPFGDVEVTITDAEHPVVRGLPAKFVIPDELYHFTPDPNGSPRKVLATGKKPGDDRVFPVIWITESGFKGRIVNITLGHDGRAHEHEVFQRLLRNSVKWVAVTDD